MFRFRLLVFGCLFAAMSMSASRQADAQPYILFDAASGKVLTEHMAVSPWYPASLTKLMTVYVVFEALEHGEVTLNSTVTVSARALAQPPAKMGLPVGERLTLDMALKIMLVKSANDIAVAVAESVGGSQEAFVQRMNYEAARLGLTGSHWATPNGLYDPANYTTARDLAVLTRAIIRQFPEYGGYFDLPALKFGKRLIRATNHMVERYPGGDGMKTGFICQSGFNLVASATRDGRRLVAIVLGETSGGARNENAARLLERGFTGALTPQALVIDDLAADSTTGAAPVDMHDMVCGHHRVHSEDEADEKDIGDREVSYLRDPFTVRPPLPIVLGAARPGAAMPVPPSVISTYPQPDAPQKEVRVARSKPDRPHNDRPSTKKAPPHGKPAKNKPAKKVKSKKKTDDN